MKQLLKLSIRSLIIALSLMLVGDLAFAGGTKICKLEAKAKKRADKLVTRWQRRADRQLAKVDKAESKVSDLALKFEIRIEKEREKRNGYIADAALYASECLLGNDRACKKAKALARKIAKQELRISRLKEQWNAKINRQKGKVLRERQKLTRYQNKLAEAQNLAAKADADLKACLARNGNSRTSGNSGNSNSTGNII